MNKAEAEKFVIDIGLKEQGKLDKVILLISSGTLALSINLIFVQKIHFEHLYVLFSSWGFLVVSIFLHMLGYFLSVKKAEIILSEMNEGKPTSKRLSRPIDYCNIGAFASVVIGILAIIIFAGLNINQLNMDRNNSEVQQFKAANINITITPEPQIPAPSGVEPTSGQGVTESTRPTEGQ